MPSKTRVTKQIKKLKNTVYYSKNKEHLKEKSKENYSQDAALKNDNIQKGKLRYQKKTEQLKDSSKMRYRDNPDVHKELVRKNYQKHKSEAHMRYQERKDEEKMRYQERKDQVKMRYQERKDQVKMRYQERKDYARLHYQNRKEHVKEYYTRNKEKLKERSRLYMKSRRENLKLSNQHHLHISGKVKGKYQKFYRNKTSMFSAASRLAFIKKIRFILLTHTKISKLTSALVAKDLGNYFFGRRQQAYQEMKFLFSKFQNQAATILLQFENSDLTNDEERISFLFGEAKHDTRYHPIPFVEKIFRTMPNEEFLQMRQQCIPLDEAGKAHGLLPCEQKHAITSKLPNTNKFYHTFNCSEICFTDSNLNMINKYTTILRSIKECPLHCLREFIEKFDMCSNADISSRPDKNLRIVLEAMKCNIKHGHPKCCYPYACTSSLLYLRYLATHFSQKIKHVIDSFYATNSILFSVQQLEHLILNTTTIYDVERLQEIFNDDKLAMNSIYKEDDRGASTNEMILQEQFMEARKLMHKYFDDSIPQHPCSSCLQIVSNKSSTRIHNLRKEITTDAYNSFLDYVRLQEISIQTGHYCLYCLNSFRQNRIPPLCRMNNFEVPELPLSIANLNDTEKHLTQRAKCYQKLIKLGTVSGKGLPSFMRITKACGQAFHLPLSTSETLKKLPKDEEVFADKEEYILVRRVPTSEKNIYEEDLNIKRVYDALKYYKSCNPFYEKIHLPSFPSDLKIPRPHYVKINNSSGKKDDTSDEDGEESKAYLTQMENNAPFYDQYTIHPLHGQRLKGTSLEIYQMLKIEDRPLSTFEKRLEYLSFPHLFPNGKNGFSDERKVKVEQTAYFKSRVRNYDPRFRRDIPYLFHLVQLTNQAQINRGIFHKLNVSNKFSTSAQEYFEKVQSLDEDLDVNLKTIFSELRNSEQYWKKPRNNLNAMILEHGPPTWFVTISPCEWTWPDLKEYLRKMNPDWEKKSLNEMIAKDPVSTSRFIDVKFHALLKYMCHSKGPLGQVERFFWRREYQSRGIQHFHLIFWIKDAPLIGVNTPAEIGKFIMKHATCEIPNAKTSANLRNLVQNFNIHYHNSYCLRRKKSVKVCRFGFPRKQTDHFQLKDVVEAVASRQNLKHDSRLYSLPRRDTEAFVNDYSPGIMMELSGNNDMSYVADKDGALAVYITKYQTKPEKSNTKALEIASSNKSLRSQLWNFGMQALNNRECGSMEAADTLLGHSLYGFDERTQFRWVDVNFKRKRVVKPMNKVKELIKLDPESNVEDLLQPSWIDTYYVERPAELNEMSLMYFMKWFDKRPYQLKDKSRECFRSATHDCYFVKRHYPYIVTHFKYSEKERPDQYYYMLLMLHKPWRKSTDLLEQFPSYADAFQSYADSYPTCDAVAYHNKLALFKKHSFEFQEKLQTEKQKQVDDSNENMGAFESDKHDLKLAMEEIDSERVEEKYEDLVKTLGPQQFIVLQNMQTALLNKKRYINFCSGMGGCGKSYLAKCMKAWVEQKLDKNVAVVAPTGIAAKNVNGITIHRLLQLPVQHTSNKECRIPKYEPLSDEALQILRTQLKNTELFIIDEVSMIGNITLLYIHLRLQEIFNTAHDSDGWFGGKAIQFFGDLCQLAPVSQAPPYVKITAKQIKRFIGGSCSMNIWEDHITFDELTLNFRQASDERFSQLTARVRLGTFTSEDAELLKTRLINFPPETAESCEKRLCALADYVFKSTASICLLATRNMANALNEKILDILTGHPVEIKALDSFQFIKQKSENLKQRLEKHLSDMYADSSRTAGIETNLKVKVGARVIILRNDPEKNLSNGDIGKIVHINLNSELHKSTIVLELQRKEEKKRHVEIYPIKTTFPVLRNIYVTRTQFPLSLAYGITIHKSQSLSIDEAIMDIGNSIFTCGQTYVALSRVRTLQGLHLINFDPSAIKADRRALKEYNRLNNVSEKIKYGPRMKKIVDIPFVRSHATSCIEEAIHSSQNIAIKETKPKRRPRKTTSKASNTISDNLKSNPIRRKLDKIKTKEREKQSTPANSISTALSIPLRFNPVEETLQRKFSSQLGLTFYRSIQYNNVNVTFSRSQRPSKTHRIIGDGNCFFRSISYIISGDQNQHGQIRRKLMEHMRSNDNIFERFIQQSIDDYLSRTRMDCVGVWATDLEIMGFAHLFQTNVNIFNVQNSAWLTYKPNLIDTTRITQYGQSLYINHPRDHFDVVLGM